MTARKTNPVSPPNPTGKGLSRKGRPKGALSKENRDLVEMSVQSLIELGGVAYLKKQGIRNPSAYLAFLARSIPLQVKAESMNLQIVVHKLVSPDMPVAGVLNSPVGSHVLKLVPPTLPTVDAADDDGQAEA